jgi:hypothetical protein
MERIQSPLGTLESNEMDNNDEILLNAARAAAAKLPALEAERLRLSEEIQRVANKISQYQAIIAGADLGNAPKIDAIQKKSSKGSCMLDIDTILEGKQMTATDIQKAIISQLGTVYGFSTIHANLKRGEMNRHYKNADGKWSKA